MTTEDELGMALNLIIANVRGLAEKNPAVQIGAAADNFNTLLAQAKRLQPQSDLIQGMSPLKPDDSTLALIATASALLGAWEGAH